MNNQSSLFAFVLVGVGDFQSDGHHNDGDFDWENLIVGDQEVLRELFHKQSFLEVDLWDFILSDEVLAQNLIDENLRDYHEGHQYCKIGHPEDSFASLCLCCKYMEYCPNEWPHSFVNHCNGEQRVAGLHEVD